MEVAQKERGEGEGADAAQPKRGPLSAPPSMEDGKPLSDALNVLPPTFPGRKAERRKLQSYQSHDDDPVLRDDSQHMCMSQEVASCVGTVGAKSTDMSASLDFRNTWMRNRRESVPPDFDAMWEFRGDVRLPPMNEERVFVGEYPAMDPAEIAARDAAYEEEQLRLRELRAAEEKPPMFADTGTKKQPHTYMYSWILGQLDTNGTLRRMVFGVFSDDPLPPPTGWQYVYDERDSTGLRVDVQTAVEQYRESQGGDGEATAGFGSLELDAKLADELLGAREDKIRVVTLDKYGKDRAPFNVRSVDDLGPIRAQLGHGLNFRVEGSSIKKLNSRFTENGSMNGVPRYRNVRGWGLFRLRLLEIPLMGITQSTCVQRPEVPVPTFDTFQIKEPPSPHLSMTAPASMPSLTGGGTGAASGRTPFDSGFAESMDDFALTALTGGTLDTLGGSAKGDDDVTADEDNDDDDDDDDNESGDGDEDDDMGLSYFEREDAHAEWATRSVKDFDQSDRLGTLTTRLTGNDRFQGLITRGRHVRRYKFQLRLNRLGNNKAEQRRQVGNMLRREIHRHPTMFQPVVVKQLVKKARKLKGTRLEFDILHAKKAAKRFWNYVHASGVVQRSMRAIAARAHVKAMRKVMADAFHERVVREQTAARLARQVVTDAIRVAIPPVALKLVKPVFERIRRVGDFGFCISVYSLKHKDTMEALRHPLRRCASCRRANPKNVYDPAGQRFVVRFPPCTCQLQRPPERWRIRAYDPVDACVHAKILDNKGIRGKLTDLERLGSALRAETAKSLPNDVSDQLSNAAHLRTPSPLKHWLWSSDWVTMLKDCMEELDLLAQYPLYRWCASSLHGSRPTQEYWEPFTEVQTSVHLAAVARKACRVSNAKTARVCAEVDEEEARFDVAGKELAVATAAMFTAQRVLREAKIENAEAHVACQYAMEQSRLGTKKFDDANADVWDLQWDPLENANDWTQLMRKRDAIRALKAAHLEMPKMEAVYQEKQRLYDERKRVMNLERLRREKYLRQLERFAMLEEDVRSCSQHLYDLAREGARRVTGMLFMERRGTIPIRVELVWGKKNWDHETDAVKRVDRSFRGAWEPVIRRAVTVRKAGSPPTGFNMPHIRVLVTVLRDPMTQWVMVEIMAHEKWANKTIVLNPKEVRELLEDETRDERNRKPIKLHSGLMQGRGSVRAVFKPQEALYNRRKAAIHLLTRRAKLMLEMDARINLGAGESAAAAPVATGPMLSTTSALATTEDSGAGAGAGGTSGRGAGSGFSPSARKQQAAAECGAPEVSPQASRAKHKSKAAHVHRVRTRRSNTQAIRTQQQPAGPDRRHSPAAASRQRSGASPARVRRTRSISPPKRREGTETSGSPTRAKRTQKKKKKKKREKRHGRARASDNEKELLEQSLERIRQERLTRKEARVAAKAQRAAERLQLQNERRRLHTLGQNHLPETSTYWRQREARLLDYKAVASTLVGTLTLDGYTNHVWMGRLRFRRIRERVFRTVLKCRWWYDMQRSRAVHRGREVFREARKVGGRYLYATVYENWGDITIECYDGSTGVTYNRCVTFDAVVRALRDELRLLAAYLWSVRANYYPDAIMRKLLDRLDLQLPGEHGRGWRRQFPGEVPRLEFASSRDALFRGPVYTALRRISGLYASIRFFQSTRGDLRIAVGKPRETCPPPVYDAPGVQLDLTPDALRHVLGKGAAVLTRPASLAEQLEFLLDRLVFEDASIPLLPGGELGHTYHSAEARDALDEFNRWVRIGRNPLLPLNPSQTIRPEPKRDRFRLGLHAFIPVEKRLFQLFAAPWKPSSMSLELLNRRGRVRNTHRSSMRRSVSKRTYSVSVCATDDNKQLIFTVRPRRRKRTRKRSRSCPGTQPTAATTTTSGPNDGGMDGVDLYSEDEQDEEDDDGDESSVEQVHAWEHLARLADEQRSAAAAMHIEEHQEEVRTVSTTSAEYLGVHADPHEKNVEERAKDHTRSTRRRNAPRFNIQGALFRSSEVATGAAGSQYADDTDGSGMMLHTPHRPVNNTELRWREMRAAAMAAASCLSGRSPFTQDMLDRISLERRHLESGSENGTEAGSTHSSLADMADIQEYMDMGSAGGDAAEGVLARCTFPIELLRSLVSPISARDAQGAHAYVQPSLFSQLHDVPEHERARFFHWVCDRLVLHRILLSTTDRAGPEQRPLRPSAQTSSSSRGLLGQVPADTSGAGGRDGDSVHGGPSLHSQQSLHSQADTGSDDQPLVLGLNIQHAQGACRFDAGVFRICVLQGIVPAKNPHAVDTLASVGLPDGVYSPVAVERLGAAGIDVRGEGSDGDVGVPAALAQLPTGEQLTKCLTVLAYDTMSSIEYRLVLGPADLRSICDRENRRSGGQLDLSVDDLPALARYLARHANNALQLKQQGTRLVFGVRLNVRRLYKMLRLALQNRFILQKMLAAQHEPIDDHTASPHERARRLLRRRSTAFELSMPVDAHVLRSRVARLQAYRQQLLPLQRAQHRVRMRATVENWEGMETADHQAAERDMRLIMTADATLLFVLWEAAMKVGAFPVGKDHKVPWEELKRMVMFLQYRMDVDESEVDIEGLEVMAGNSILKAGKPESKDVELEDASTLSPSSRRASPGSAAAAATAVHIGGSHVIVGKGEMRSSVGAVPHAQRTLHHRYHDSADGNGDGRARDEEQEHTIEMEDLGIKRPRPRPPRQASDDADAPGPEVHSDDGHSEDGTSAAAGSRVGAGAGASTAADQGATGGAAAGTGANGGENVASGDGQALPRVFPPPLALHLSPTPAQRFGTLQKNRLNTMVWFVRWWMKRFGKDISAILVWKAKFEERERLRKEAEEAERAHRTQLREDRHASHDEAEARKREQELEEERQRQRQFEEEERKRRFWQAKKEYTPIEEPPGKSEEELQAEEESRQLNAIGQQRGQPKTFGRYRSSVT